MAFSTEPVFLLLHLPKQLVNGQRQDYTPINDVPQPDGSAARIYRSPIVPTVPKSADYPNQTNRSYYANKTIGEPAALTVSTVQQ
jgi:hypothetical protein